MQLGKSQAHFSDACVTIRISTLKSDLTVKLAVICLRNLNPEIKETVQICRTIEVLSVISPHRILQFRQMHTENTKVIFSRLK